MTGAVEAASAARTDYSSHGVTARSSRQAWTVAALADFESLERDWRRLETLAPHSGYQRFDWVEAIHRHLGAGRTPALILIRDEAGAPAALLPLEIERRLGQRIASFIGGSHVNFGLGLWRPDFAATMDGQSMRALLREAASAAPGGIDIFRLTHQPFGWAGLANPFAQLPHQASPSFGHALALRSDGEALLAATLSGPSRKKLRKKQAHLEAMGAVTFARAETPETIEQVVDRFLVQKAARFQVLGLANVFAAPEARAFILEAANAGLDPARGGVELYALSLEGEPVAIMGGVVAQGRFSGMFNSIAADEAITRESPGDLLLVHLIKHLCARGLVGFDLGVGEARYKSSFCDRDEALFDTFHAATAKGAVFAQGMAALRSVKRQVKQTPWLWALATSARRRLAR